MAYKRGLEPESPSNKSTGINARHLFSCFSFCLPRTHKKRLEDTNVYEIVESTNGKHFLTVIHFIF